jgi:hypothetical protein
MLSLKIEDHLFAPFFLLNIKECTHLGVNKGVNNPPRGESLPLVAKLTPRGKLHLWGQLMLLKTVFCPFEKTSFLHAQQFEIWKWVGQKLLCM